MQRGVSESKVENHVFLMGRPPMGNALGYLKYQTVSDSEKDVNELANVWRTANDHVKRLAGAERNLCDANDSRPLSEEYSKLMSKVEQDPVFHHAFGVVPVNLALVEIDKLVVYQQTVNLDHVERLEQKLGATPTPEAVFDTCFPTKHEHPDVTITNLAQNAIQFASPSNDIRFLQGRIDRESIIANKTGGMPIANIVLSIGFGTGYVNAILVGKRLLLNNGMNRAYTLKKLGFTHMPCVVQIVTREEEHDLLLGHIQKDIRNESVNSPRPALLKDFFEEKLRHNVTLPRKTRVLTVEWNSGANDIAV